MIRSWCMVACCVVGVSGVLALSQGVYAEDDAGDRYAWLKDVSGDHPRMFFTAKTWPTVKKYTLTHEKKYYQRIKRMAAALPKQADAKWSRGSNTLYGPYAQVCAFVWLMEGDRDALAKAKNYLGEAVKFYNRQSTAGVTVNWYSASRVCAMTAYDWIYQELSPAQRKQIGQGFFKHYRDAMDPDRAIRGQNRSNYKSGFYGPSNMAWYVGLTFFNDGIDDEQAVALLKRGYDEHIELLDYRATSAGDDGGIASIATGYAFGMYPWAEYNFMHTFKSATGKALEETYTHHSLLPNWVYWNYIPAKGGGKGWGLADSQHTTNNFSEGFLEMHMLQIAHFYAKGYRDRARFALWVRENLLTNTNGSHDNYWWPLAPFFLTNNVRLPSPKAPGANWPKARYFETMGVTMMRSGNQVGDTFAAFVNGGVMDSHRHYDQGHFIIYKNGFVALDSGTYGDRSRSGHLTEYKYRSVAHNTVLVRDDDNDQPAKVWGGPANTLDGGQYSHTAKTIAFETNDRYTYIAVDMTDSYSPKKVDQVIRQFVFVYPDHFVVYDRVTSRRAGASKAIVLHTARKPVVGDEGKRFTADQDGGRMVVDTIIPFDAKLEVIGGPGKEFYSAGKNWEHTSRGKPSELWGNWRVEVSPGLQQKADTFLQLIRVGDRSISGTGAGKAINQGGDQPVQGIRFTTDRGSVSVSFNETGPVGGSIVFHGSKLDIRPLTQAVAEQVAMDY